jgi:hypothetical protein
LTRFEADLMSRLSDADAVVQADLAGWTSMFARLEQATRQ